MLRSSASVNRLEKSNQNSSKTPENQGFPGFSYSVPAAGLIMISKAYYQNFVDCHVCDDRFIRMAQAMGMQRADKAQDFITMLDKLQKDCGVDNLKMSDYGFTTEEFLTLAQNARTTMGGLFASDPMELSDEDCVKIFEKSYR